MTQSPRFPSLTMQQAIQYAALQRDLRRDHADIRRKQRADLASISIVGEPSMSPRSRARARVWKIQIGTAPCHRLFRVTFAHTGSYLRHVVIEEKRGRAWAFAAFFEGYLHWRGMVWTALCRMKDRLTDDKALEIASLIVTKE